jgi:DNA-binding MarR family transcriptional regulator
MIEDQAAIHLTQTLFQVVKRLPHLHLNVRPIEGLTKSEHELLVILRFNINDDKTMLSASEVAGLLQITPAGGTHLYKPLESAGYIVRIQDPKDRRVMLIGLTGKGMEVTDALLTDLQREMTGLIEYLGEADSRAFIGLLAKVFDYITPRALA